MTDGVKKSEAPGAPISRRSILQLGAAVAVGSGLSGCIDVTEFGAGASRRGKRRDDTSAVQRAIDACAERGGGTVLFPSGEYTCTTLFLKSRVTLHLDSGALLQASSNVDAYPLPHLLYAFGQHNFGLEGLGTIDGGGDAFFDAQGLPLRERPGPMIELVSCQDVRIEGLTLRNAARWTVHPKNCDRVWVMGVSILNSLLHRNTDGINPDSCRTVFISNCFIEAGDDCIAVKTSDRVPWKPDGYSQSGSEAIQACENVLVSQCVLISAAAGIKVGTETAADIRHCMFSSCVIRDSSLGIAVMAKDGGAISDLRFDNLTVQTRCRRPHPAVEWPIVVDVERRRAESPTSTIERLSFSRLRVITGGRIMIAGIEDSHLSDIRFRDIALHLTGIGPAAGVHKPRGGRGLPIDQVEDYGSLPAAMGLVNIRNLEIIDTHISWEQLPGSEERAEERHALYAERVDGLRIHGLRARPSVPGGGLGAVALRAVSDGSITASRAAAGTRVFLELHKMKEGDIWMQSNDFRQASVPVWTDDD